MGSHWLGTVFSAPDLPTSLSIAAKTLLIYLFIIGGLRLVGTRELGQLSTYDFVLIVVIANSVQNAMVGGDNTLAGGLISAVTLLLANRGLTILLTHAGRLERGLAGEPIVLIGDSRLRWDAMRRTGVTRDELLAALREHGVATPDDVQLAVLEVDGTISVVPKDSLVHRTRHRVRGLRTT